MWLSALKSDFQAKLLQLSLNMQLLEFYDWKVRTIERWQEVLVCQ